MALVLADRVREGTNTAGTGTVTLTGAVTGFASFADQIGNGNTTYYTITDGTNWEVGVGTYNANTLSRDTVLDSSTGSKINFAAGFKDVFVTLPAEKVASTDTLGTMSTQNANAVAITGGAIDGTTVGATTRSTGDFTTLSANTVTSTTPVLSFNASNSIASFGSTTANSYNQLVIQNKSGTTGASTNYVISNNLGTDSTYYGEFGMNASTYSSGTPSDFFSLNNGVYFSSHDGDVTVGSGNGYKTYLAWGTAGDKAHVVNASGAIGLNTNITGTTNFGTSGQVLTSAGSAATPTWSNAPTLSGATIDNSVIGATTAATGKFTTLESTGTASLGTGSTTYVRAIGDASYPGIYVTGGTNTPLVLQPLGTGAIQAQKTDSTATGGNARGANAVDWQTTRGSASQVASGAQSVVAGGSSNTSSAQFGTVSGGAFNGALAFNSTIGGGASNSTQGNYSAILAGANNQTLGAFGSTFSGILAGAYNQANGFYNFIGAGFTNSGTSASAVTTQSGTMNGTTAVTLSGSNANIKVGQYITGTSIGSDTYVAAISGTSLTLSKVASGSSTSTLSFYTPHGVVVGGGNNQATGSYSFIGGGGDAGTAANRNVASGDWSFVGSGKGNTASGLGSVIVGGGIGANNSVFANTASGVSSVIGGGIGHTISGQYGSTLGGAFNSISGVGSSSIAGRYSTDRSITGLSVLNSGYNSLTGLGTSQACVIVLAKQTTDATATVLTSDGGTVSTVNQVILPNNSAYYFKGTVVAGVTGGGNTKGWTVEGVIKRGANAAATALVGTPTVTSSYTDAGASTWALTATADTTNGGLAITFTGQAGTTIRCVAKLETVEMTF